MERNEHQAIMLEVAQTVERVARDGRLINVTAEADRLLEKHPGSRIQAFDLVSEIARLASERGLTIEFGPAAKLNSG